MSKFRDWLLVFSKVIIVMALLEQAIKALVEKDIPLCVIQTFFAAFICTSWITDYIKPKDNE